MLSVLLVLIAQAELATRSPPAAEVTPRTKAILAKLEEPVAMAFPKKKVTLGEVLQHIQRATKKGPNDPGIPIYIDPLGLQRAHVSPTSRVSINQKDLPLKDSLARVFASLGMAYVVKDDVLIISDLRGIERERNAVAIQACDALPPTKELLARLEEPVKMSFPAMVPLGYLFEYVERATARPPDDRGIAILAVPDGLEEVGRTLDSTMIMDLEGVPLKTTLRLMLDQLGLACVVKDGRLVIHSRKGIQKLLRNATGEPGSRDAPASS